MTLHELYTKLDSAEIAEWMAYDLSKDPDFNEKIKKEEEMRASGELDGTDSAALFRSMGGVHSGNDS